MEVIYLPKADDDLSFWIRTGTQIVLKKLLNSPNPYY